MAKRKAAAAGDAGAAVQQPGKQQKVDAAPDVAAAKQKRSFKNKEKVLVLGTRGITYRSRHLMSDFISLLPHSKKDVKLDTKSDRGVINEVAEEKGCSSVLFFEARKRQDLYLWMAKSPDGPTVKFLVLNVHTMDELKLTGNHLKGSRPVLSFDAAFDAQPHTQLLKEQLAQVFGTPRGHHRVKPFFDHVLSFTLADGCVWLRNYQVVMPLDKKKADPSNVTLVEVGPRAALRPIRIFEGSFGGPVLYDNPEFVAPNVMRRLQKQQAAGKYKAKACPAAAGVELGLYVCIFEGSFGGPVLYDNPEFVAPNVMRRLQKQQAAGKYKAKVQQKAKRRDHEAANVMPRSEIDDVFRSS
ncbi:hypothetical protein OEZ86_008940 [Tetradesmus obliquus]|nr:hypothetical protein OEZ86_008940 [Tetradesmus obliquus]